MIYTKRMLAVAGSGALALACAFLQPASVTACSRVVYANPAGIAITGRNMDWHEDLHTNLWVFPRGMKRDGVVKQNALVWTSKYGSVIASAYDIGTVDGINEKGLTANVLFLRETDYGKRDVSRPGLSVALWTQYYLDNFASVAEAVEATKSEPFQIATFAYGIKKETLGALHLAISDKSGDSAILEYLGGKLVIHHSREFKVVTNSPPFPQQLAQVKRFKGLGGKKPLPHNDSGTARFARAAYHVAQIPTAADAHEAFTKMMGILEEVTEPYGGTRATHRAGSPTIWRTISDATSGIYYFSPVPGTKTMSVELAKLDFTEGAAVKKLSVSGGVPREGDVSGEFVAAQPFTFLGP